MTLHRRLKEHFQQNTRQYIISRRLTYAQHLLQNTDKTISIIAKETGFYDIAHFSRVFKKAFGMSPKDYR
jgi:AraC-like DNA-binding protein